MRLAYQSSILPVGREHVVVEALVADSRRDDAGIDAVHGRGGRDIVLSPVAHGVFPGASGYGKGTRQSCAICGEAVQTGQNRMTDDSDGLREEGRETGVSHPLRIRLHLSYLLNARRYLAVEGAPLFV